MKVAFITGGSRGLGKQGALELAKKGVNILFTYANDEKASFQTKKEIESLGVKASFIKLKMDESINYSELGELITNELEKNFGTTKIDYLINNAGFGYHESILNSEEEIFVKLFNTHVKNVFFLTQALIPSLNDGGSILNISSGLTRFSYIGYSAYAMMKGAIEVFTRYLVVELGDRNIRANTLAPGAIETDFSGGAVRDNKELNKHISSATPLGRVGLPQDIGKVMANLLDDELYWVNGERIEASGGIHH